MAEAENRLKSIVEMALSALPRELGCDDCFEFLAAYAERVLSGEVPESMKSIEEHLERCPCCTEELNLLLEALKEENHA